MTTTETFDPLARVQAYQLAMAALREGKDDVRQLASDPLMREVATQLMRALGSIGANIAEGYSRGSINDRRRFLEYALGSTREAIVWYEATAHPAASVRTERLVTVRRLLLTMIRNARLDTKSDRERTG